VTIGYTKTILRKWAIALAIATASASAADASTLINYTLSGTVSAENYSVPFYDQPYELSFVADRDMRVATSDGYEINPVVSAVLVSPFAFTFGPIKIGINTATHRFFFGSTASGASDAVVLQLTASQTDTIVNDPTFGSQAGSAQFYFDGLFSILGASLPPGLVFSQGSATGELTAIAVVPETSTWIIMILGFAGVGFAVRHRNRMALQTR
jgi:hypothetical protein